MKIAIPRIVEKQNTAPKASRRQTLSSTIAHLKTTLFLAFEVKRERAGLKDLSEESLQDIGINRQSALIESRRAFSDIPTNRRLDPKAKN